MVELEIYIGQVISAKNLTCFLLDRPKVLEDDTCTGRLREFCVSDLTAGGSSKLVVHSIFNPQILTLFAAVK